MQTSLLFERLANQRLIGEPFHDPVDAVRRLGAVQAQDYAGAKWAIAQRVPAHHTDDAIERAIADGLILRTHVLRPTWHFVAAEDIRWMLELSAPRIIALAKSQWARSGLDAATFKRSNSAIAKALATDEQLTRAELAGALRRARVDPGDGGRLGHLMMRAELDGVVCSGARRGKQFTYALLESRAPGAKRMPRDEALRELAIRYFTTRGPATLRDFSWWSGLTVADARRGVEAADDVLASSATADAEHWSASDRRSAASRRASAHLLPNYDEFLVAYGDRGAMAGATKSLGVAAAKRAIFTNVVAIGGEVAGTWRRTPRRESVSVELTPLRELSAREQQAVDAQVKRYAAFAGLPAESIWNATPERVGR